MSILPRLIELKKEEIEKLPREDKKIYLLSKIIGFDLSKDKKFTPKYYSKKDE